MKGHGHIRAGLWSAALAAGLLAACHAGPNLAPSPDVVATVNGCASEVSNTVIFDINTGLWIGEVPAFNVAPNPTDGPLTIRTDMTIDLVEVWNAVGQKVMEQRSPVLDLSPLTPGVYQVVVLFKGQRWQARIVRR